MSPSYISSDGSWIVFLDTGQMRSVNIDSGEYKMVGNPATYSFPSAITANGSKILFTGDYTAERNEESGFFPTYDLCSMSCILFFRSRNGNSDPERKLDEHHPN